MMHFSQSKSTKCEIFAWNFDFSGTAYCRDWYKCHWIWHTSNPKYVPLKPFWCIFPSQNQQNVKFLPEILIFQQLLIVETWNKCHWIWHTLNPKYMPLKPFWWHFSQSTYQQNVKFLPEILIFQELLIIETWNKCHWIWHVSNPKYVPLKPFWCIFPSQNQQNVKFLPDCRYLNKCHCISHTSNPKYIPLKPLWCIFPSQKSGNGNFWLKFDFSGTTYIDTWNLCHWILAHLTLHMHSCHYDALFPSQNQQKVKFLPQILISQERLMVDTWSCAIGFGTPQTLNMCHSSHYDAFFPVKINKMWNFCLKFWFFRNYWFESSAIGTPQTYCHSDYDAFFPVKIYCEIFAWNFDFSGTAYQ